MKKTSEKNSKRIVSVKLETVELDGDLDNAMKTRIVERTYVDGTIKFVIQRKLFFFVWVDAWNMRNWCVSNDSFNTLELANKHLCYFNGSVANDRVIVN